MNKELLRQPFPPELIKQREGYNGKMLSYVATHAVIARLNDGCDNWNFEIVEHHIYKTEVVVVGRLTADGIVKMAFGGSAITTDHNGKVISLADDLKAAASDALKKAASLLGVGLELYAGHSTAATASQATRPTLVRSPGRVNQGAEPVPLDKASERQLNAIKATCRSRHISDGHLATLIERHTGKKKQLHELTRREASKLLDEFNGANGAHR